METFEFDGAYGIREMRGCHFVHSPANGTNLMTMIVVVVTCFVFCTLLEVVPHHQPQFHEEIDGIVESGPTYPEVVVLHFRAQLFQGEMAIHLIHCIKYGKALWGLPEMILLQIIGQRLSHLD